MTKIHETHWLVRTTCVTLGAGAALGILVCLDAMFSAASGSPVTYAVVAFIYLAVGAAAVSLWFGDDRGLQATRLLLLIQIPVVQSASFSYLFYSGAIGALYGGSKFGLQGQVGSSFSIEIHPGMASDGGYIVGANLLAVVMLVILGRVDLLPFASPLPPPLAQSAP